MLVAQDANLLKIMLNMDKELDCSNLDFCLMCSENNRRNKC